MQQEGREGKEREESNRRRRKERERRRRDEGREEQKRSRREDGREERGCSKCMETVAHCVYLCQEGHLHRDLPGQVVSCSYSYFYSTNPAFEILIPPLNS